MNRAFSQYALDTRPVDAMSAAQISLILGLETVLQEAGLVLTCPHCAAEEMGTLHTDNSPEDEIWKIDCQCRRRRVSRSDAHPMKPSGDLLLLVPQLLHSLSLDVRCPSRRCLLKPLEVSPQTDGVIATCHCGGKYHFKKKTPKPH